MGNFFEIAKVIMKFVCLVAFCILSSSKTEETATEQLKKYIDLIYLRMALLMFILYA